MSSIDLSFIIISWNTRALLQDCIASVLASSDSRSREIIIVDNGSADGSPEMVRERFGDAVHLITNSDNRGFAAANNQALRRSRGRYYILLNSDARLRPGAVEGLAGYLDAHPRVAMVGPRMVGDNGRQQNSFDNFPSLTTELLNKSLLRLFFPQRYAGKPGGRREPFEVDSLIGACLAVRAEAARDVGFFDEDYFFFLEETDWCLRMHAAGWRVVHDPRVEVVHLQGRSKQQRPLQAWIEYYRSLYLFFRKNRSPGAYAALRIFRFFKLIVNLVFTAAGHVLTLGRSRRCREKTAVYAGLVWWHLRRCPRSAGLRGKAAHR